jgi:two-component system LytT family response regulator
MRAMIVDDEPLSLDYFERLLAERPEVTLIGRYTDPRQALAGIAEEKPEVVFLDIEMPEINGISLAEKIQAFAPRTNIVFVTAYREYAIQAFELNAIDYLLKPIQKERLEKTLQRLTRNNPESEEKIKQPTLEQICMLSSLRFQLADVGNNQLEVKWRTAKAKELFAFLLHHRQKPIRKDHILDVIWAGNDPEKSVAQLYSAIYQLRKLTEKLALPLTINSHNNSYLLDLQGTPVDAVVWEQRLFASEPITKETIPQHLAVLEAYSGDYLAEHAYLWAEAERERLRALWLHHATKLGAYLKKTGETTAALAIYRMIQERYPYMEDTSFMLMQLYDRLGDRNSVIRCYKKLVAMLKEEYDTEPSEDVQTWYDEWNKQIAGK